MCVLSTLMLQTETPLGWPRIYSLTITTYKTSQLFWGHIFQVSSYGHSEISRIDRPVGGLVTTIWCCGSLVLILQLDRPAKINISLTLPAFSISLIPISFPILKTPVSGTKLFKYHPNGLYILPVINVHLADWLPHSYGMAPWIDYSNDP